MAEGTSYRPTSEKGFFSSRVEREIEQHSSLSGRDWALYSIMFHRNNKLTLKEIKALSIPEFMDYREALDALDMMIDASHKDAEMKRDLQK